MTEGTFAARFPTLARACWIVGCGIAEIREEPLPILDPGRGEVLVRSLFGGISRGTESLVIGGRVPESQYDAMRCPHQAGSFPWPTKYGYATVGRVDSGPADWRGRTVFALYPHQDLFVLPAEAVVPVPDGVPPRRAVLAANLETAVNATWDAPPLPGMRIAVVGGGTLGGLLASLLTPIPGVSVCLVDPDPSRAAIAEVTGAAFEEPERARRSFADRPADLVYHASGHPEGLATALALAGMEALVAELSWYGDRAVPAPLGEAFHARRLRLVSSQVGCVAPTMRARWRLRDRLSLALALLTDSRYDAFLSDAGWFSDLPEILAGLAGSDRHRGMPVIRYEEGEVQP